MTTKADWDEAEKRRPGITAFHAEVLRIMRGGGGITSDSEQIAKALFTSEFISVILQSSDHAVQEKNPHIDGANIDQLPRTLNRYIYGLEE